MTKTYQILITGVQGVIGENENKVLSIINEDNSTLTFTGINGIGKNITSEVILVNET